MIADTKTTAAKIADRFFYVAPAMFGAEGFDVRSMRNGAKMFWRPTKVAADRAAVRLAIGRLKLAKTYPGIARENEQALA
jgi:hypothetical protein